MAVEKIRFHERIVRLGEEVVGEEFLVESGSNLGEEDWIMVVLEGLVALRIPSVHGVARLVREGEHVGEDIRFVIHEDVGWTAVAPAGKGAAAFAFRLVAVAPAAAQSGLQFARVFPAERCGGGNGAVDRLVEGKVRGDLRDEGDVGVVVVDLFEAEGAAAEFVVTVEGREVGADR